MSVTLTDEQFDKLEDLLIEAGWACQGTAYAKLQEALAIVRSLTREPAPAASSEFELSAFGKALVAGGTLEDAFAAEGVRLDAAPAPAPCPHRELLDRTDRFTAKVAKLVNHPRRWAGYECADNEHCGECAGCLADELDNESANLGRDVAALVAADQARVQKAFQDCQQAINAETHGGAVFADEEPTAPATRPAWLNETITVTRSDLQQLTNVLEVASERLDTPCQVEEPGACCPCDGCSFSEQYDEERAKWNKLLRAELPCAAPGEAGEWYPDNVRLKCGRCDREWDAVLTKIADGVYTVRAERCPDADCEEPPDQVLVYRRRAPETKR